MLSIASVLPATFAHLAKGSTAHASGKGKGASHWASLFGSTVADATGTSSSSTSNATSMNADLLGQITSLLQNGTPMATIVDQLFYGVTSLAVPIIIPPGRVIAAVNTSGYSGQVTPESLIQSRLPELRKSAARMSELIIEHPLLLHSLEPRQ